MKYRVQPRLYKFVCFVERNLSCSKVLSKLLVYKTIYCLIIALYLYRFCGQHSIHASPVYLPTFQVATAKFARRPCLLVRTNTGIEGQIKFRREEAYQHTITISFSAGKDLASSIPAQRACDDSSAGIIPSC